jgi:hypothetical protein
MTKFARRAVVEVECVTVLLISNVARRLGLTAFVCARVHTRIAGMGSAFRQRREELIEFHECLKCVSEFELLIEVVFEDELEMHIVGREPVAEIFTTPINHFGSQHHAIHRQEHEIA